MLSAYRRAWHEARASYTPEKREDERQSDLPAFILYRPLSFVLTPFFMLAGLSANGVTLLGLGVALLMPVGAALGQARGALVVASLAVLFQVLDCVDGNLARMRRTASTVGQMLDSITSLLFWALYLISVGVAAEGRSDSWLSQHGVELGLGLAVALLAQRELEDTFESYCGERVRWTPPSPAALPPRFDLARLGRVVEQAFAFGLFAVAEQLERLDLFLAVVTIYQGGLLCVWLVRFSARLRARMSVTAPPPT